MAKLYESGALLLKAKEWLQSSEQRHLANAAIIVANFARSGKFKNSLNGSHVIDHIFAMFLANMQTGTALIYLRVDLYNCYCH